MKRNFQIVTMTFLLKKCSRLLIQGLTTRHSQYIACACHSFKSQYHIENIYPNSNPDFLRANEYTSSTDDPEKFSGYIALDDLSIKHLKGSGPGGQHVNKVNTKVEVRFHVSSAEWIPIWVRDKLQNQEKGRINKNGYMVITSDKTRKQLLNQADCIDKIRTMIYKAAVVPKEMSEEDRNIKEKRIANAKYAVLREKRRHSLKKQDRQGPTINRGSE